MLDILISKQDLKISSGDLESTDSLETAYLVSLGAKRQAYWGDFFDSNFTTGSDLYILTEEALTDKTPAKARRAIETAIDWTTKEGIVKNNEVTVWRDGFKLKYTIDVTLNNGELLTI